MSRPADAATTVLDGLTAHCQHLRLTRVAPLLPTLLEQAAQQELSYSAFLDTVLATEVAAKQEKHRTMRVQMARFPGNLPRKPRILIPENNAVPNASFFDRAGPAPDASGPPCLARGLCAGGRPRKWDAR